MQVKGVGVKRVPSPMLVFGVFQFVMNGEGEAHKKNTTRKYNLTIPSKFTPSHYRDKLSNGMKCKVGKFTLTCVTISRLLNCF